MTTASGAEEVAFTRGFEREPEATHEATIKVGRNLWSIHGMTHRILEALGIAQSRALSMAERGPEDFAESGYERGFSAGRKMTPPNIGGVSGNSKLLTALMALNTALLIGVGGWLLATVARHDRELAVIACQLNPQQCPQVNRGTP